MTEPRLVEMDLFHDFAILLRAELVRLGYNVTSIVDDEESVRVYFGVCRRLISPEPRQVLKSKSFSCPHEHRNALARIEGIIESGGDIIPCLSRRIRDANYDDHLLNDWGIHHLHLGIRAEADGFMERTGPLLYCRFEEGSAYFIDVLPHDDFTSQKLLKTMHENWPDLLSHFRVNGIQGDQLSDEEIKVLRKKNMNYCIEVEDGISYHPPGGGVTFAGTNVLDSVKVGYHLHWFDSAEKWIIDNIEEIAADALEKSVVFPNSARFRFQVIDEQFYAAEEKSGVHVPLNSFA